MGMAGTRRVRHVRQRRRPGWVKTHLKSHVPSFQQYSWARPAMNEMHHAPRSETARVCKVWTAKLNGSIAHRKALTGCN